MDGLSVLLDDFFELLVFELLVVFFAVVLGFEGTFNGVFFFVGDDNDCVVGMG